MKACLIENAYKIVSKLLFLRREPLSYWKI